jgi:hypothetical protein
MFAYLVKRLFYVATTVAVMSVLILQMLADPAQRPPGPASQ